MQFNIPAEHKNASGVYIIRNTVNSKVYVGSAKAFWQRFRQHFARLRNGTHVNKHLQAHANKYGTETLEMSLLEACAATLLLYREQHYLDNFKSYNPELGFNKVATTRFNGSHLGNKAAKGYKQSPETIAKRIATRRAMGGYEVSEETRTKMSAARKGIKRPHTSEQREKMVASRRARNGGGYYSQEGLDKIRESSINQVRPPVKEETKQKISAASKGRKRTDEQEAKRVATRRARGGFNVSEETRTKMSAAKKGYKQSAEQIEKIAASRRGKPRSEETKRKMSETIRRKQAMAHSQQSQLSFA